MLLRRSLGPRLISDDDGAIVECGECHTRISTHPDWCYVGRVCAFIGDVNRALEKGKK